MRPSVLANFRKFNGPFEGVLPFMYSDAEGLVTTGMGRLRGHVWIPNPMTPTPDGPGL